MSKILVRAGKVYDPKFGVWLPKAEYQKRLDEIAKPKSSSSKKGKKDSRIGASNFAKKLKAEKWPKADPVDVGLQLSASSAKSIAKKYAKATTDQEVDTVVEDFIEFVAETQGKALSAKDAESMVEKISSAWG